MKGLTSKLTPRSRPVSYFTSSFQFRYTIRGLHIPATLIFLGYSGFRLHFIRRPDIILVLIFRTYILSILFRKRASHLGGCGIIPYHHISFGR